MRTELRASAIACALLAAACSGGPSRSAEGSDASTPGESPASATQAAGPRVEIRTLLDRVAVQAARGVPWLGGAIATRGEGLRLDVAATPTGVLPRAALGAHPPAHGHGLHGGDGCDLV
jgi:hypothetical protein